MALTNEQITAQNFKSFYNQIRPYLNGQIPVFANRFNKSDLYSTDEQLIGRWIDGKPIYQKTIIRNGTISKGSNTVDPNVVAEHIVNISGTVFRDRYFTNVVEAEGTTQMVNTYYNNIDHLIHIDALMAYTNATAWVTLQYTKPEESTISITDGNEYSTDEQVVGKWIDGRPIYQKTVQGTTPASSGTRVDVGLPTLVQIIDVEGYVVDKDNWTIFVGTQKQEGVINQDFFVCHNVSGDSKIWFGCGSSTVNRPYTLTFRYIKSS